MIVLCDNQAAIRITENLVFDELIKHIKLKLSFYLCKIQSRLFVPYYIRTSLQIADIFTNPLRKDEFHRHIGKLG